MANNIIQANVISGATIRANVEGGGSVRVNVTAPATRTTTTIQNIVRATIKDQGPQGIQGIQGIQGEVGEGVAAGGTTGQLLAKNSDTNYDTEWVDSPNSAVWGNITGSLSDQLDLQEALDDRSLIGHNHNSTYLALTGGTLSGDLVVPDEAYSVGWNGSLEVPTKNAVYDKIQSLNSAVWGSITGTLSDQTDLQTALDARSLISHNHNSTYLQIANNLSDLGNAATARTNLGLGTVATLDSGTGAGDVPVLDGSGKLNTAVLPALSVTDVFVVASQAAQLALTAEEGDVAIRSDLNKSYIHNGGTAGTMADWNELLTPTDVVLSVDGRTGVVTLNDLYAPLSHVSATTSVHGIADTANLVSNVGTSADNAVARFDATTGKIIQNSLVTITDTGLIQVPNDTGVEFGGGGGSSTTIKTGSDGTFLFDTGSNESIKFKGGENLGATNWGYTDTSFNYIWKADTLGNALGAGYLRVGSMSAPTNTTAGDITGVRLMVGTDLAFGTVNGQLAILRGTYTDTASTSSPIVFIQPTYTPTSNSATEFRAISFQNVINPATGVTFTNVSGIQGGYFENRVRSDGLITALRGLVARAHIVDSGSAATTQSTNAIAFDAYVHARPSGTSTATITTGIGYDTINLALGGGLTATTLTGFRMANPAANTITTLIGLDVASLTRAATNIGVRIALPSGGATANYALQLSDTGGTAAGGITFGTDANLYRAAANALATDDSARIAGYLNVGSISAPINTTAGDLTAIRALVGTDATLPPGISFYVNTNAMFANVAAFKPSSTPANSTMSSNDWAILNFSSDSNNLTFFEKTGSITTARVKFTHSGDALNSGYLSVGTLTAPTNTTAGDITGVRLVIGTQVALGSGIFTNIQGTITDVDITTKGVNNTVILAPTANTSGEARAYDMSLQTSTAFNFTNSTGLHALRAEIRHLGTGNVTTLNGLVINPGLIGSTANGTITTMNGINLLGGGPVSGSPTATITTYNHIKINQMSLGAGPITVGTQIGIDIPTLTAGTTDIGIRIAKADTYSLQLSDTGGTAAGGITFGTDTQIFRGGAGVLHTSAIRTGGYIRVGSLSVPFNTTAGDLTSTRLSVGNSGAFSTDAIANFSGTSTATSNTIIGINMNYTLSPASNSAAGWRVLLMSSRPSTASDITGSVIAGYFENRMGSAMSGTITTTLGQDIYGFLADSSSNLTLTGTNVFGIRSSSLGRFSGTSLSTITTAINVESTGPAAGFVVGTYIGVRNVNPSNIHSITTNVGFESQTLTRGSTTAVGIRLGQAASNATTDNHALQLSAGTINFQASGTTTNSNGVSLGIVTYTQNSGEITAVNATPTAAGTGYVVGDKLVITTGGVGGVVNVDSVGGSGDVTAVSLVTAGLNYTTGTGKATGYNWGTTGSGSGCTVNITSIGAGKVLTNASSLYIAGAPVASTNVTITNGPYSIWVDGGTSRFDGAIDAQTNIHVSTVNTGLFFNAVGTFNYGIQKPTGGTSVEVRHGSASIKTVFSNDSSVTFSGLIAPITTDTGALGSTSLMWSDLFLASGGVINFNNGNATITHSAALLTSNVDIAVPDEAYGVGWNGSLEVPTKNAIYDEIESLVLGGGGAPTDSEYVVLSTDATLTDERVLTAGKRMTITDAGAGSTVTIEAATNFKYVLLEDEFLGGANNSTGNMGSLGWNLAGTVSAKAGELTHPGMVTVTPSSTINNIAGIRLNSFDRLDWDYVCFIVRPLTITNINLRVGLSQSFATSTAETAHGIYFSFIPGTDSHWRTVSVDDAGTTVNTTTVTVNANDWYLLELKKNSNGTDWDFYINETFVFTHSTNLLRNLNNDNFAVSEENTAGGAVSGIDVDYFAAKTINPMAQRYT